MKLLEIWNNWIDSIKKSDNEQFRTKIKDLQQQLKDLKAKDLEHIKELNECDLKIKSLEDSLKPKEIAFNLNDTIKNLKSKTKGNVYKYAFKGDGVLKDIREALKVSSDELIISYGNKIINKYKPKTPLECVESVMKYFIYVKRPRYVTDEKKWHKRDYWENSEVFLESWTGDCDAISNAQHRLIKYILDKNGFSDHYDRLYWHINDNYLGGHANNIWLHTDGYFYTIESSIDAKGTFKKKWLKTPLANDSFYTNTRGIANLNYNTTGNGNILNNFIYK